MTRRLVVTMLLLTLLGMALLPLPSDAAAPVPDEARIVQDGEYDIIVLADDVDANVRSHVFSILTGVYGDSVKHWTVKEKDAVQYVYAYPYAQSDDKGTADARTSQLRDEIQSALAESTSSVTRVVCNRVYKHAFWLGTQFMICGNEGSGGHGYARLDYYGFNNMASSYYCDSTTNEIWLYDGFYSKDYLTYFTWDVSLFGRWVNDKTSSMYGFY